MNPRIAFLSRLLEPTVKRGLTLETALAEWANLDGCKTIEVRSPVAGSVTLHLLRGDDRGQAFAWPVDITERLHQALHSGETQLDPNDPSVLYVPMVTEGRRNGGVRLKSSAGKWSSEAIGEAILMVQAFARSPLTVARLAPAMDHARILQRLADAASVAGRIAHDFDNIFTGVIGFNDLVLNALEPNTTAHEYLTEVADAASRGVKFTAQLHQLSRSSGAHAMPTTLAHVTAREEARVRSQYAGKVQFRASVGALPAVAVDAGALAQMLGVLLDNACEASPSGGLVTLAAELAELSDAEARGYFGNVQPGTYVRVTVSDHGAGVKEEHRPKLFTEPFFTTKARHRGLGLVILHRMAFSHRGGVRRVPSNEPGTAMQMVLPLSAARPSEPTSNGSPSFRVTGGPSA